MNYIGVSSKILYPRLTAQCLHIGVTFSSTNDEIHGFRITKTGQVNTMAVNPCSN